MNNLDYVTRDWTSDKWTTFRDEMLASSNNTRGKKVDNEDLGDK